MKSIIGHFSSTNDKRNLSQHYYDNYTYEGTSPEGIVYRTKDGFSHEEFYTTGDKQVTAISDFGGALFFGTSPNGRIYVYNFNTSNKFLSIITGDNQVTSFEIHNNKLYAGTSPSGIVYSFDGLSWNKEYEAFGGGIKSMTTYGDALYVFLDNSVVIPCLNALGEWSFMVDGDKKFSISDKKKVTTTLDVLEKNLNHDYSFTCSAVFNEKLYFSGGEKAVLYEFDGSNLNIVFQSDGDKINSIEPVGDKLFISIDDILYKHEA